MQVRPIPGRRLFRNYARFGMACTGALYLLMGTLAGMAAFGLGGEKADQQDLLPILHRQPFGRVFIAILVVGLGGYVLWRLDQAFADPERLGRGPKGLAIRFALLASAAFYGTLAWTGLRLLALGGREREEESSVRVAAFLLDKPHGNWWIWALSIALLIAGLVQFHRVITGRFKMRIRDPGLRDGHPGLVGWTGVLGFSARGVVLLIAAYLFFRAGRDERPGEAGGTEGAMGFLQALPSGPLLLAVVAAGLAAYGIFLSLQALSLQDDLAG